MEPIFLYLIKTGVALAIFYAAYILLFKPDTFFVLRRYYLLSAIVFSLLYPFFTVDAWSNAFDFFQSGVQQDTQTHVFIGNPQAGAVVSDNAIEKTPWITWQQAIAAVWIAGALFLIGRLLLQLISIFSIRRRSVQQSIFGIRIHDLSEDITPFSFFRWIFIYMDAHSDEELRQIVTHEKTHARQWHSADILLVELLCVVCWWNPFVWLLKREIAGNLEYLADHNVLQSGINSREYQYHLLRLTYHETAVQIVNNFNVSQLKNRIMMMNKSKSPVRKLAKYLLMLPLALLLVAANSCMNKEKKSDASVENTTQEVSSNVLDTVNVQTDEVKIPEEEVFVVVEEQPEFPGGVSAMMKYISSNIKYPIVAQDNGIEGRVICNFIVEKDGRISDVQVVRSVDPSLDKEAVKVIESMPNWKPAKQRGKEVRVRYTLLVVFKLQGDKKKTSSAPPPPPPLPVKEKGSDDVFVVVEKQPEFSGGMSALMKYLSDNIKYPVEAQKKGTQGRVICNFVVMNDGSISDVNVVRGVDPLLDAEAVRVLETMPNWKPGMQRGQPVNVRFTLPISFNLKEEKSNGEAMKELQVVTHNYPNNQPNTQYLKFLSQSIKYPAIAQENGIMGLVEAVYSTDNKGNITSLKITKGVDPSLDNEVKRIIRSLPSDLVLEKTDGKANSAVAFSALFRLQNENSSTSLSLSHDPDVVVVGYGKEKNER